MVSVNVRIRKIFILLFSLILLINNFSYAKRLNDNPFAGEVEKPEAVPKTNKSEGILYHVDAYEAFSPINPVPVGVNKEEYDSVDNFNIDLNTLNTRIKYFSPVYKNVKAGAESSLWMAFYATGGNIGLVDGYKSYNGDDVDAINECKDRLDNLKSELSHLDKTAPDYPAQKAALEALIFAADLAYRSAKDTYSIDNRIITATMGKLGHRKSLSRIANVDNMTAISSGRDSITNMLSNLILTYLKVDAQVEILSKQEKLYKDMYELSLKNYSLGNETSLSVSQNLNNYENVKTQLKALKATSKNLKSQIATNLGYKETDLDKLVFVEPEVDISYIENVNLDDDRDKAYNSNSAYTSITLSSKDKKYPGSTGETLYNKRREHTAEKIVIALEDLYNNMQSALLAYQSSYYLSQICELTDKANEIKRESNLISDMQYDALTLQNLSNKLLVKIAKYDLITATNNYYYGTMGQITVS